MRKLFYTAGQIVDFIADKRERKLFIGRVRAMHETGLIVPDHETPGGHLRFDLKALALAAVYSHLFDMGLSVGRSNEGVDATPFKAALAALWFGKPGATAIERAMAEVAQGRFWALRIDFMHDAQRGSTRWFASAYPTDAPQESPSPKMTPRKGEHAVSSILITLNPIILPLVTDRSGMN